MNIKYEYKNINMNIKYKYKNILCYYTFFV